MRTKYSANYAAIKTSDHATNKQPYKTNRAADDASFYSTNLPSIKRTNDATIKQSNATTVVSTLDATECTAIQTTDHATIVAA